MPDDQTTVEFRDDADVSDDLAMHPVDIDDVSVDGGEVLGAVEVRDASDQGVWSLALEALGAVRVIRTVAVDDRLEEATYAVVRLDDE